MKFDIFPPSLGNRFEMEDNNYEIGKFDYMLAGFRTGSTDPSVDAVHIPRICSKTAGITKYWFMFEFKLPTSFSDILLLVVT